MIGKTIITLTLINLLSPIFAQIEGIKEVLVNRPETDETVIWLCDTAFTFYANDPAITQRIADLALEKAILWEADSGRARANHVLGISFWARDMYDIAIQYYLEALEYYEKVELKKGVALINMNIGTIYDDLEQPERGKPYLARSVAQVEAMGDSLNLGRGLNNLAVLYSHIDQQDSALIFFQRCLGIRSAMGDSVGVARVHNNIADMYIHEAEPTVDPEGIEIQIALQNLQTAVQFLESTDDSNLRSTIYANLGKVHFELGDYSKAGNYLDDALIIAKSIDSKLGEKLALGYYREMMAKRGRYEEAFEYLTQETALDHEIRNSSVTKQIEQLNIQYQTEKKERQLAVLEKEKAEERGLRNIIIVSASSVILIIGLLLFLAYQKRKKDQQIARLKVQRLKEEVDLKNKEISSYTLSFIQKNQIMDELKDQISEIKKQSDPSVNKQLNRINRIVDETFRSDEEWKSFQLTFEQMHDGFFTTLKDVFPDLGNAELKLCALLRLNMNLKESAKILGISPESVKTARYRLRKKLGLKTEENLVDFLLKFEQEHLPKIA